MRNIVINPRYQNLEVYLNAIPENFNSLGTLLYDKRNVIREDYVLGTHLIIKSFKRIYLPNRIRYTYWHASKAARAYNNAHTLLENGFNTPDPIAYVEVTKHGLLAEMFFVCAHTLLQPLQVLNTFSIEETTKMLLDFTRFTHALHQRNIYHIDYNITNILFDKVDNAYVFSLIDNNRMEFGTVSFTKGLKNFRLLKLTTEQRIIIGKEYARLCGIDPAVGAQQLVAYSEAEASKRKIKKWFKKLLKPFKRKTN